MWSKKPPEKVGDYWMRDCDGGPSLYECVMKDGELYCGLKANRNRFPVEVFSLSATTEWKVIEMANEQVLSEFCFAEIDNTDDIELCGNKGCGFNVNRKCTARGTKCFGYIYLEELS
jgi:hypothetical protein